MGNVLKNIKDIRINLSYSQEFISTKLGMEQVSYGLIENGKRKLKYETLEQIALVFNMNVIDIITYPDVYEKKEKRKDSEPIEAVLQIKLQADKKEQVLKLVLGENNFELLSNI
jgi:transcriptional regulator with XRE-family HTH domain